MRIKVILSLSALFFFFASSANGQTSDPFQKYEYYDEGYSVSSHIWMIPTYTEDGQVCELLFYPKKSSKTFKNRPRLDVEEMKKVFNEILPVKVRGKKIHPGCLEMIFGMRDLAGCAYENVIIRFASWLGLNAKDENILSGQTIQDQKLTDEIEIPKDSERATVEWKNRKCPEK